MGRKFSASSARPFEGKFKLAVPAKFAEEATKSLRAQYGTSAYFDPKTGHGRAESEGGVRALAKFMGEVNTNEYR